MARKADIAAAKARKQKMTLIILGVAFVGIAAFQGPKLMNQLKGHKSTTATPATTTTTGATTETSTTTANPFAGTTSPAVATATGPSAKVAGILLRSAGMPAAQRGQLWSLSQFKPKDPFVQQVKGPASATGTSTSAGAGSPSPTPAPTGTTGTGTGTGGVVTTPTTASPAVLAYATLLVNGKIQQLQLKQLFPKGLPTFVLLGVGKNFVKIGVAGGKFVGGGAVKLEIGKPVTVMNTTTGQRFVMKLTFTGAAPEQIAGFKPAAPQNTTGGTQSAQTQTQATP